MGYNFTAATKLLEYSVFRVTGNHIPETSGNISKMVQDRNMVTGTTNH